MNDDCGRRGHGPRLWLLIPVVLLVAHGMQRHKAWHGAWHQAGQSGRDADDPGARLPARIQAALDAWHARAHEISKDAGDATA